MKTKRIYRTNFILLITSASILLLTLVILFFNFQLRIIKGDTENFYVSFYDNSKTKEDPSCRLIIDDSIIFEIEKISKSKPIYLVLKNGNHNIEISDLNNNYYAKDSVIIKNYPEDNNLYVSFIYNPSYEEYLPEFRKVFFNHYIKRKNKEHSTQEYHSIKKQIYNQIDLEFLKKTHYKPMERRFEITFYEGPIIIM